MEQLGEGEQPNESSNEADDLKGAQQVSAVFTNRFFVRAEAEITRIAFGELVEGAKLYHSAIAVPTQHAVDLALLILRLTGAKFEVQTDEIPAEDEGGGE